MSKLRITVLISGNGSNLQALIDDVDQKLADTVIVRVISNRKGAYGLVRAEKAGIPTAYHNLLSYKRKYQDQEQKAREEYDADLAELILKDEPNLVVCAGFMHVLSPKFLEPLEKNNVSIINLHPALRGQYNGANAIERAHKDFMEGKITQTGVMIHYVISEVDMGEPILQQPVQLSHPEDDNIEDLEARIHEIEHKAIVEGTRIAAERIRNARKA
ncbi:phosphoribosylglycinamide formyltransferase [Verruconis gallopava]|uniref:Phosphoribosylglycinamide formyltransferase n=1 Tax=Verruconis gallopava TaxID=253628 RepID=A0A0D2A9F0_9PEZI|nr:phosphoribosylglycinamide formyltransferase [Verruconis gallopava]KIW03220.1 phosphoribosylglycinamide formyltransferase [Verruconis gallopava]